MPVNGDLSIIAHHKILISAQRLFLQVPVPSQLQIRLSKHLPIHTHDPVPDLHRLTRQADNPFEIHHPLTGHADGDDIEPLRIPPAIDQGIHEAVVSRLIHGKHAVTLDPDRQENRGAHSIDHGAQNDSAHQCVAPVGPDTYLFQPGFYISHELIRLLRQITLYKPQRNDTTPVYRLCPYYTQKPYSD